LALGEKAGIDRKRLAEVLGETAVISPAQRGKLANAVANEFRARFLFASCTRTSTSSWRTRGAGVPMPTAASPRSFAPLKTRAAGRRLLATIRLMRHSQGCLRSRSFCGSTSVEPASDVERMVNAPAPDRLPPALLLALTAVTGSVDAVSYLALGHVFTANMTGNVVFLGFAMFAAPGLSIGRSGVALGAFVIAQPLAAGLRHGSPAVAPSLDRVGCGIEAILLLVAATLTAARRRPLE